MKKNTNNYFTPSELSKLTGVSRQLLIYYDNNDIFKPDIIAENGYRYYSFYQYFMLETIVALRKMDISLCDIKTYLTERNVSCLKDIYTRRISQCETELTKLQNFKLQLQKNLEPLNRSGSFRLDQILLTEMPKINPSTMQVITMDVPPKERMRKLARFLLPTLKSDLINDYYIGYCVEKNTIFSSDPLKEYKVFLQNILPGESDPYSLYLNLYTKFDHNLIPEKIKQKISDFVRRNNLDIISDVYLLPISNHLIPKGENQRINRVYIQVEYKT